MRLVALARFTADVPALTAFYRRLIGTDPVAASDDLAVFQVGATRVLIHRTYEPEEGELPPSDHVAFAVSDLDTTCRELVARGLALEVSPQDYHWGRSAYLRDPDGRQIELTQAPCRMVRRHRDP